MLEPSNVQYKEEADLLAAVKKWLEPQERDGIKMIRVVDRYTKGYSDLFINAKGRFVVAELKDDTGTPSTHQEDFIEEMIKCGAIGGVCRSVKDVADLIDQALYCRCATYHHHHDCSNYDSNWCDLDTCGRCKNFKHNNPPTFCSKCGKYIKT